MPPVNVSLVLTQRNKNKKKLKMIHHATAFDIKHAQLYNLSKRHDTLKSLS